MCAPVGRGTSHYGPIVLVFRENPWHPDWCRILHPQSHGQFTRLKKKTGVKEKWRIYSLSYTLITKNKQSQFDHFWHSPTINPIRMQYDIAKILIHSPPTLSRIPAPVGNPILCSCLKHVVKNGPKRVAGCLPSGTFLQFPNLKIDNNSPLIVNSPTKDI